MWYYQGTPSGPFISHHGIKGQKWGVRRYQNADGTRTPAGKERMKLSRNVKRNAGYTEDVNSVVRSLSKKDKQLLGASANEDWIDPKYKYEIASNKAYTHVTRDANGIPVSFAEIWTNGAHGRAAGQISVATRNGEQYRRKGYASRDIKALIDWADRYGYKSINQLEWCHENGNNKSQHLAEKFGFVKDESQPLENYTVYHRPVKPAWKVR